MKMIKVDLCALWHGFSLYKDRNNIHKRSAAGSAPCCSAFCSRSRGGQVVSRYHWVIRLRMGMMTWIDDATECDDYKPWGDDTRYKNVETTSNLIPVSTHCLNTTRGKGRELFGTSPAMHQLLIVLLHPLQPFFCSGGFSDYLFLLKRHGLWVLQGWTTCMLQRCLGFTSNS